jgi:hypothetical protein
VFLLLSPHYENRSWCCKHYTYTVSTWDTATYHRRRAYLILLSCYFTVLKVASQSYVIPCHFTRIQIMLRPGRKQGLKTGGGGEKTPQSLITPGSCSLPFLSLAQNLVVTPSRVPRCLASGCGAGLPIRDGTRENENSMAKHFISPWHKANRLDWITRWWWDTRLTYSISSCPL